MLINKRLEVTSISVYNKHNDKFLSKIYLFSYLILLVLSIIRASNLSNIFSNIFNGIAFVVLFLNILIIFLTKPNKCLFPLSLTILFIILLIYGIKIASLQEILVFLICYNSNLFNEKKFVKYNLLLTILPIIFIIILNIFGIIPNVQSNVTYIVGEFKGNGLGFAHPNTAGEVMMGVISSLFIYLDYFIDNYHKNNNKLYIFIMLISLFISIYFYKVTNCRELLYFEILIFILLILIKIKVIRNIFYILLIPISIMIPSLFIYWDYHFKTFNKFYYIIDSFLSGRIDMQHTVMIDYPIKFIQFVKNIPNLTEINNGTVFIDNSFVALLESSGLISILIAGFILLRVMLESIHIRSYILCTLIFTLIICSCIESSLFSIYLDGPFIFASICYSQTHYKDYKTKSKKDDIDGRKM